MNKFNFYDVQSVESVREAFEHALSICGADIVTGSEIFTKYIDFELDEHDLVLEELEKCSPENKSVCDEQVKLSKQRFVKLFHRQAALPLVGNEDCVSRFHQVLSELCVASDVKIIDPESFQRKYQQGLQVREARLTYELHINSEDFTSGIVSSKDRETSWLTYIAFEVKNKEMGRAQRLYERALMDCQDSLVLWLDYAEFAFAVLKNYKLVVSLTDRCLRVIRQNSFFVWKIRLLSVELLHRSPISKSSAASATAIIGVSDAIDAEIQRCFTCGALATAQDTLEVLLLSCEVNFRSIKGYLLMPQEEQDLMSRLAASFEYCESCLLQWFPQWDSGLLTLYIFWANAEYQVPAFYKFSCDLREQRLREEQGSRKAPAAASKAAIEGCDVWERAVHAMPQSKLLFVEYINWVRSKLSVHEQGADSKVEFCRRLLKRYVSMKYAQSVDEGQIDEWMKFEKEFGSALDVHQVFAKIVPNLRKQVLEANSKSTEVIGASSASVTTKSKRPVGGESEIQNLGYSDEFVARPLKKARVDSQQSSKSHEEVVLLVGNFPFGASEADMEKHIKAILQGRDLAGSSCEVPSVELLFSKSGTSRGLAKVKLALVGDADRKRAVQAAIELCSSSEYQGRRLTASEEVSMGSVGAKKVASKVEPAAAGSLSSPHLTTVFVSKLATDETSDMLKEYFAQCGEVLSAKVSVDKKTGLSKVRMFLLKLFICNFGIACSAMD